VLAGIWKRVLGIEQIGIHDNFFDLGGHSLLAVRLFVEIERRFGQSLPLASIFTAPTVEQLAALICDTSAASSSRCLVILQDQGDKPPLFCVSGLAGHAFIFRQLALHLGPEQPVYGLHYPGLDGQQEPLTSIEEIATEFIRHIRQVQPQGPYYLCGLCFAGLVVYEMAQQLTAQQQPVAMVALLDTFVPRAAPRRLIEEQDAAIARDALPDTDSSLAAWIERVRQVNREAAHRYRPQPYAGRVVLFRPTKRRSTRGRNRLVDPLNGWGDLVTGGVEVHSISGYHNRMLSEPKVQRLARKMRAYLVAETTS
jgi:aspartate racemase